MKSRDEKEVSRNMVLPIVNLLVCHTLYCLFRFLPCSPFFFGFKTFWERFWAAQRFPQTHIFSEAGHRQQQQAFKYTSKNPLKIAGGIPD